MSNQKVQLETPDGDAFQFDAWITGNFGGQAIVTDHPIEDGSRISDHSQIEPLQITLDVRQTETPLDDPDDLWFGEARITEAMDFLRRAGRAGDPLTVTIPRVGVFENMVLSAWPNEIDRRRSSAFEVTLRQIEIAATAIVDVPIEVIDPPARAGQQDEEDLGRQSTEEIDEDEPGDFLSSIFPDEDSQSALSQIAGAL